MWHIEESQTDCDFKLLWMLRLNVDCWRYLTSILQPKRICKAGPCPTAKEVSCSDCGQTTVGARASFPGLQAEKRPTLQAAIYLREWALPGSPEELHSDHRHRQLSGPLGLNEGLTSESQQTLPSCWSKVRPFALAVGRSSLALGWGEDPLLGLPVGEGSALSIASAAHNWSGGLSKLSECPTLQANLLIFILEITDYAVVY